MIAVDCSFLTAGHVCDTSTRSPYSISRSQYLARFRLELLGEDVHEQWLLGRSWVRDIV